MSDYHTYPNDQPVVSLDCTNAFNGLTDSEKLYAHHISRAAWYGGLIVLLQISPESPLIFVLLRKVFRSQSITELKDVAISHCDFTDDEFKAFLVYASGIFSNMGNYKSSGDSKFIPKLPKTKFEQLVLKSKAGVQEPDNVQRLLDRCLEKIYSLTGNETHLGFPGEGMTTYLSKNFTAEDAERCKGILKKENLGGYNMRTFKTTDETGNQYYEFRFASVKEKDSLEKKDVPGAQGYKFYLSYGDYKGLLKYVNDSLEKAKSFAGNKNQRSMLEKYIASFETGLLEHHIEGSRFWIKDVGPTVETYIGFIETYRDPDGIRGEFEGFVAVVNSEQSKKFAELVQNAEKFLPLLPWPKTYEKDRFLRPDFTSLDVLTFSGGAIPHGINIPNYDEVKQNEGFKNVSLGNVIFSSLTGSKSNYITEADEELLTKYRLRSYEINVGLHELLGHGSGKLLRKNKDGTFNFDVDNVIHLETNKKLTSWYEDGESYDIVFGALASSYEECRAECVSLHLVFEPRILSIFGFKDKVDADNAVYVLWFDMCLKGVEAMQVYDDSKKNWKQAHAQARYVILQVLLEAGEGFVNLKQIDGEDGKPDLLLTMDREKMNVGRSAMEKFLRKLQLYKSTADVASATALYEKYSKVDTITYQERVYPFLKYKEIVMARKKPRKFHVQANTSLADDGKVVLHKYENSHEGLIQSWIDRFKGDDELENILEVLALKDFDRFP